MKKLLVVAVVFGGLALVSCKKSYTCTFTSPDAVAEYDKLSSSEADEVKETCEAAGGTWSSN